MKHLQLSIAALLVFSIGMVGFYLKPNSKANRTDLYKHQSEERKNDIHFSRSSMNLGKIRQGGIYGVDFSYSNEMDKPLIIYSVKSTCGCTIANWDKKPLKANGTSKLKVRYKASRKGFFTKTVRVSSNARNGVDELTIKGIVI